MKQTILLSVLSVFFCLSCFAHDLWIVIDNYYPAVGEKVRAKIMFSHKFPEYDILISRKQLTEFYYITPDGQKKEVVKTWEEKMGAGKGYLIGEIPIEKEGTYIICASRKIKGENCAQPSEKYGKAIVTASKGNNIISQSSNNRLEIIPLITPSEMIVGDTLPLKILYEGEPLSTHIYGTYAGYCSVEEPFYTFTRSDENGMAYMKISQPGLWFIAVNFKRDFSASLTYEMKQ